MLRRIGNEYQTSSQYEHTMKYKKLIQNAPVILESHLQEEALELWRKFKNDTLNMKIIKGNSKIQRNKFARVGRTVSAAVYYIVKRENLLWDLKSIWKAFCIKEKGFFKFYHDFKIQLNLHKQRGGRVQTEKINIQPFKYEKSAFSLYVTETQPILPWFTQSSNKISNINHNSSNKIKGNMEEIIPLPCVPLASSSESAVVASSQEQVDKRKVETLSQLLLVYASLVFNILLERLEGWNQLIKDSTDEGKSK